MLNFYCSFKLKPKGSLEDNFDIFQDYLKGLRARVLKRYYKSEFMSI